MVEVIYDKATGRSRGFGFMTISSAEEVDAAEQQFNGYIRLIGLLHSDYNCALKEISRQLCSEHQLKYSKMASSDDNCQFMVAMLRHHLMTIMMCLSVCSPTRECGLAHKTIVFVLDEFDLFTQAKAFGSMTSYV